MKFSLDPANSDKIVTMASRAGSRADGSFEGFGRQSISGTVLEGVQYSDGTVGPLVAARLRAPEQMGNRRNLSRPRTVVRPSVRPAGSLSTRARYFCLRPSLSTRYVTW
jgi:hypothetical protein